MDKQTKIKRAMHDEITRLRAECDDVKAERDAARAILRALLNADERGQGIAWQEAMGRARAMIQTPS